MTFGLSRGGAQHSSAKGERPETASIRAPGEQTAPAKTILQSWKEIAAQLNCSVRTVQRRERMLGLPVRRVGKGPRSRVFAFQEELQRWLQESAKAARPKAARPKLGLLQSISDFLSRGHSSAKQLCDQCNSPMTFLKCELWIYGTSRKWNLSMPCCPACDAEALESCCRSQIIQ